MKKSRVLLTVQGFSALQSLQNQGHLNLFTFHMVFALILDMHGSPYHCLSRITLKVSEIIEKIILDCCNSKKFCGGMHASAMVACSTVSFLAPFKFLPAFLQPDSSMPLPPDN